MSSPIQPAKGEDRDTLSMYAPSRKRKKPPVVDPPIKQTPHGRVVHAGSSPFSGLAGEDLRPRRSLTPEIIPEPKFLKSDRPARALIALRLSGATAIATLIALVMVSLPDKHQRPRNDNIQTSLLPNVDVQQDRPPTATAQPSLNEPSTYANEPSPYSGSEERQSGIATVMPDAVTLPNPTDVQQQRDQSPTAAAPPSLDERRTQKSEPPPHGGSVERQSGIATVVTDPVTNANAIMPATGSSPSVSQFERTRTQLDDEEIAALIKRGRDFVRNRDFSSARLLLKRAAEAGSAAAALSMGETFDPLVLQQFHEIGVQPDLAQARDWYERAAQLGSDGASQRLAKIAPPPQ
jgi:hypothetical protein